MISMVLTSTELSNCMSCRCCCQSLLRSCPGGLSHMHSAEYMVPDIVMPLDEIPRLPNGKVNRRGLPEPDFQQQRGEDYEASGSEVEQQIQRIWQAVWPPFAFCILGTSSGEELTAFLFSAFETAARYRLLWVHVSNASVGDPDRTPIAY